MTRNAAALVDAPRLPRRETEHLSAADVRRLIAAAATDPQGALYVLAVTTGLRKGEALALMWRDVDLDAGMLHVRASVKRISGQGMVRDEPKTASSRRSVPLPGLTVEFLRRHRVASRPPSAALDPTSAVPFRLAMRERPGLVRPGTGRPGRSPMIEAHRRFAVIARAAGVPAGTGFSTGVAGTIRTRPETARCGVPQCPAARA